MGNRIMASLFLPFLLSKTTTRLGYVLLLIPLSEIIFSNNHNVDYLFLRIVLNNGSFRHPLIIHLFHNLFNHL